ncbi:HAD family hydrolase [Chloroflexota bacterium]
MKYKAVIFDLFGTLVGKFPIDESIDVLRQMADVLSAPSDDMVKLWFETFDERHGGKFQDLEDDIRYVSEIMGIRPDAGQVTEAARINLVYVGTSITPRPGAIEVLSFLNTNGYKVGLVSNWSDEVPTVWDGIPLSGYFDVSLFSCRTGILKPDPRIYLMAAEQLGVKPEECLYVGDGDSEELAGAAGVGMHPVLINAEHSKSTDNHPVNKELEEWDGHTISSLTEIISLLENPSV